MRLLTLPLRAFGSPSAPSASSAHASAGGMAWPAWWAGWWRVPWHVRAGAGLLAAGGIDLAAQWELWPADTALAIVNLATVLAFVLAGLLLGAEPGQHGLAWALILTGVFRGLDWVDEWNTGPFPLYGLVFGAVDRVFGAWALLRYPNPGLRPGQRRYLLALTGWMLAGRSLIAVTSTRQWNGVSRASWWPALIPDSLANEIVNDVANAGESVFGVVLIIMLVRRLTGSKPLDRIILTPVVVAGISAVLAAAASAVAQMMTSLASGPNGVYLIEGLVDLAVPLAFLVSAAQRAGLLGNVVWLAGQFAAGADVHKVQDVLRVALRDPTLDVRGLTGPGLPAGADGTAASPPGARVTEFIRTGEGTPIAVVSADPALARHPELFEAAVRTSGLALEKALLQAQAAEARLNQVRESRIRIVEASLDERRRLERDLHDGAQQRLLALATQLTLIRTRTTDPAAATALQQAQGELRNALADLRDLARGIHPAVLTQRGLNAAVQEVTDRLDLPVHVDIPGTRFSPAVEATAYFVICEALTNVVKHAGAGRACVTARLCDGRLELEITDDGAGGVDDTGHGIGNMRDRVGALDGELSIDSRPGAGTRVAVTIPCG